jgi:hypothetical protein
MKSITGTRSVGDVTTCLILFIYLNQVEQTVKVGSTDRNLLVPASEVWLRIVQSMVPETSVFSPFNHLTRLLVRQ